MNSSSFPHTRGHIAIYAYSGCMYHRPGIISESDVINSRELTNTFKPVRIGLVRPLLELSGEVRSHLSLAHSIVGFLGGLDG